jgi:hypothetical protein
MALRESVLAAESERLLGLYNDADLLRIITGVKKRLPARKPARSNKAQKRVRPDKPQMDWSSPKGVQTRAELQAICESRGLHQEDACRWWQKWAEGIPDRRDWPAVNMHPESLKRAVFGRGRKSGTD